MRLRLGISSCPNDIFAFYAILERKIDLRGLEFDVEILDVQELNDRLKRGLLDCSKASFHAALHLADRYGVLRSGSAIGEGVGPILLSREPGAVPGPHSKIICPGAWTTAVLLFRCLYPESTRIEHRIFSDIMPAVRKGEADFGVVIHEGRFTYQQEGLHLAADLGDRWEKATHGLVPLGGILARLDLPSDCQHVLHAVLHDSIEYAFAHREETFPLMQKFAQELEPNVIWSHVELYVNELTRDLGAPGEATLQSLRAIAIERGIVGRDVAPLQLLG